MFCCQNLMFSRETSEPGCNFQTLSDPGRSIRAAFRTLLRDMIDPYPRSSHAHPEILTDVSWIAILQNPGSLPSTLRKENIIHVNFNAGAVCTMVRSTIPVRIFLLSLQLGELSSIMCSYIILVAQCIGCLGALRKI